MNTYFSIKNLADIDTFIEKTNALHDGYIIAAEFHNNGIMPIDFGHEFNSEFTQMKIHVLITSMQDTVLEMIFDHILKWKITDSQWDMLEAAVRFDDNGFLIWTDDATVTDIEENDSYVIARNMKWRIL